MAGEHATQRRQDPGKDDPWPTGREAPIQIRDICVPPGAMIHLLPSGEACFSDADHAEACLKPGRSGVNSHAILCRPYRTETMGPTHRGGSGVIRPGVARNGATGSRGSRKRLRGPADASGRRCGFRWPR